MRRRRTSAALAVLGLVYAAGDASKIAADANRAVLDGLALEGVFAPEFSADLRKAAGSMLVVEIAKDANSWRWKLCTDRCRRGCSAERTHSFGNGYTRCALEPAVDRVEHLAGTVVRSRLVLATGMDQQPIGEGLGPPITSGQWPMLP